MQMTRAKEMVAAILEIAKNNTRYEVGTGAYDAASIWYSIMFWPAGNVIMEYRITLDDLGDGAASLDVLLSVNVDAKLQSCIPVFPGHVARQLSIYG
jgi:hypothetical protein